MLLTYHEIVDEPSQYLYAVTAGRLKEHVAMLRRRNTTAVDDFPITFDDGLSCHYAPAAEILDAAGFRGIFFVASGWVGQSGFMTGAQLRELVAAGHQVHSHSHSHQLLPLCSPAVLRDELVRSKNELEQCLGSEVDAVAFPGGAYDRQTLRATAEAGYRKVYTSNPWQKPATRFGLELIGRLMLRNSTTAEELNQWLDARETELSLARISYAARQVARSTLGFSLYHKLWRIAAGVRHQPETSRF